MLRNEDLDAAVKAGVITAEQQAALEKQAGARRAARPLVTGRDERFRFLRGFNDVFLALGVTLVAVAFLAQWRPTDNSSLAYLGIGIAVLWALSELLVGRHRAVLPGIVAVIGIGLMTSLAAGHLAWNVKLWEVAGKLDTPKAFWRLPFGVWMAGTGAGGLAVLIYYVRFGLPFAWLPMGYCLAQAVVLGATYWLGWDTALPLINIISLTLGLGLFSLAMRFDASDPERITRRADCGFWLHLAAAPFIVQPLVSSLGYGEAAVSSIATIVVVGLLAVVALVVDRRALLVSSLLYFGLAVGFLVTAVTAAAGWASTLLVTLGLLGAFVIFMGLGWHRLRGLILRPFAGARWLKYIPPLQPTI